MIKILLHFFLLSFKYPKVTGYLIFYSELRLIFVYLESDSSYWSAWVSPRLFLGQAGCSGLTWFVRWREGGQSSNPSHLTPTESQRERAWAEPRQRQREREIRQNRPPSLPSLTWVDQSVFTCYENPQLYLARESSESRQSLSSCNFLHWFLSDS